MIGKKFIKIILVLTLLFLPRVSQSANWQKIIDRNKNALITIRYYAPYKLNNESIGTFFATGIIVDKEKGIVLVDRESSQVSPSVVTGYLQNYEEIDLKTIYFDPIHNYAFMKFDPSKVSWKELGEISLGDSDSVNMGDEIILLATKKNKNFAAVRGNIVDIRTPKPRNQYKYQDYNISYFDTSLVSINEGGGIILDKKGRAVALHAWIHEQSPFKEGKDKNFFSELPINFVKGPLSSIVEDTPVQRGDLGILLNFITYSEALNFGLPKQTLRNIKKQPSLKGMLYISGVVRGTHNHKLFLPGDIIITIDGYYIGDDFFKYEEILNSNVGKDIFVNLLRNGKSYDVEVNVFDLLKVKPDKFVLFSGGVFQNIPWFIRVRTNIGSFGIYVSNYYGGSPLSCSNFFENNVITNINGVEVKNIDEFYDFIKNLKDDDLLKVRYVDLILNNKESIRSFRVNKNFFPTRLFLKGSTDGDWNEVKQK